MVSVFLPKFLKMQQSFSWKIVALLLFLKISLKKEVCFHQNWWLFNFGFYSAFEFEDICIVANAFSPIKKLPVILALKEIVCSLLANTNHLHWQLSSWLVFFLYRQVTHNANQSCTIFSWCTIPGAQVWTSV